jgi:hypothetical protein
MAKAVQCDAHLIMHYIEEGILNHFHGQR